jgi:hypothetical protein
MLEPHLKESAGANQTQVHQGAMVEGNTNIFLSFVNGLVLNSEKHMLPKKFQFQIFSSLFPFFSGWADVPYLGRNVHGHHTFCWICKYFFWK